MPDTTPTPKLKISVTISRSGEVREIVQALSELERVYNHLYAWNLIVHQAKEDAGEQTSYYRRRPRRSLRRIRYVDQVVLPEDRLYLARIEIASPGWAELVGALNPLESLRKYLQDRHLRRQDRQIREPAEAQRLALENEHLRTEVVREQVELLRSLNFPEDQIRQALSRHIFEPADSLDQLQDSGLIEEAKVVQSNPNESRGAIP